MKKISAYVLVVFVLASMLLGACAGTAPSAAKVNAAPVAYTGTIESIDGNQWVVNGQAITVDPSVVKDGPYNVGDVVKIEVEVSQDGSVSVTRVEQPTEEESSQLPEIGDDNSNDENSNDDNSNDDDVNSNDDNSNDADVNSNNDDSQDDNINDSNSNDDDSQDDNANDSNSNDDDSNDNSSNSNHDSSDDDSDDDNSNESNSNSNSN